MPTTAGWTKTRFDIPLSYPQPEALILSSVAPEPPPSGLLRLVRRAWGSWATRSLAVGGVATALDVMVLLTCVKWLGMRNPVGAMVGVTFGSTFTFFANRHFAFRDHQPRLAPQAIKFALATGSAMVVHASLVWLLADRWLVPVVFAKLIADLCVFSVGQLLMLRYLVFPKQKLSLKLGEAALPVEREPPGAKVALVAVAPPDAADFNGLG